MPVFNLAGAISELTRPRPDGRTALIKTWPRCLRPPCRGHATHVPNAYKYRQDGQHIDAHQTCRLFVSCRTTCGSSTPWRSTTGWSSPAAGASAAGGTHGRSAARSVTWRSCRKSSPPMQSRGVWRAPGGSTTGPSCRLADTPASSAGLPPSSCGEARAATTRGRGPPAPPVLRASRNWHAHPRGNIWACSLSRRRTPAPTNI